MAITASMFGQFIGKLANEEVDIGSDTWKVALTTSSYLPDQDTHEYFDDVTNEVTGTGYTAGGATLGSVTWGYTSGTNTWTFDAADTTWTTSTITAAKAVVYDSTPGSDATNPLACWVDFDGNYSSSGGTFQITWNASGIFSITVS